MKSTLSPLVLGMLTACAVSGSALADKPSWAGNGKNGKEARMEERRDGGATAYFNEETRRIIGDYYGRQARAGKCPPGLAKKNNGCLPPGQAKKWAMGQPLPGDLRYQGLPGELLRRLPPLPAQQRYVQIAGDILVIAAGTNMVLDAMEDILR